jgi:hypothetical protein
LRKMDSENIHGSAQNVENGGGIDLFQSDTTNMTIIGTSLLTETINMQHFIERARTYNLSPCRSIITQYNHTA